MLQPVSDAARHARLPLQERPLLWAVGRVISEDDMHIHSLKSRRRRLGSALLALAAATALSGAAAAQEPKAADAAAPAPSITLPTLPPAPVTLGDKAVAAPAAQAAPKPAGAAGPSGATPTNGTAAKAGSGPADGTRLPAPASPASKDAAAPQEGQRPADAAPEGRPAATPSPVVPADAASPTEAAPASEPVAALPPIDAALKGALEALVEKDLPRGAAGVALRKEYQAIAAFYAERNDAPLWIVDGHWTPAAKSALARLERAGEDGLDIEASTLPVLEAGDPATLAARELALSQAVVSYGRQASGGRIRPRSISAMIFEKPEPAAPAAILHAVAADAGAALEGFNPQEAGYKALRDQLAELRRAHGHVVAQRIPRGPVLKVGMRDARVPLIRARFQLGPDPRSDFVYDRQLAEAVAHFQRSSGLPASGTLTSRTVVALTADRSRRLEDDILANMELWRWLPREVESEYLDVNVADFTVSLVHDGEVVHRARVIVGKPTTPTPLFSNAVKYVEINPWWDVPPSIVNKEMLPHLATDPTWLEREGYQVSTRHGQLVVRQPPGPRNALGRIKFMFPNPYAVYLHDTPQKSLFSASRRAFSHGCVRVDQPLALAALVLANGWSETRLQKLVGGANRTIRLAKPLPIHIEYFTAWVDDRGRLQLRDDVYGYTRKIKLALGLHD